MKPNRRRELMREALSAVPCSLRQLSQNTPMSSSMLSQYLRMVATPEPASMYAVGEALSQRGRELARLGSALRRQARRDGFGGSRGAKHDEGAPPSHGGNPSGSARAAAAAASAPHEDDRRAGKGLADSGIAAHTSDVRAQPSADAGGSHSGNPAEEPPALHSGNHVHAAPTPVDVAPIEVPSPSMKAGSEAGAWTSIVEGEAAPEPGGAAHGDNHAVAAGATQGSNQGMQEDLFFSEGDRLFEEGEDWFLSEEDWLIQEGYI